ncbi:MAG: two-component regulator propeller domain-containing protein, partial [Flavitalea sp.]
NNALKKLLLIFWLSVLGLMLSTSVMNAKPVPYLFNRLSSKEGLASNFFYTIFQDSKGFMWFGTANGLQRYDGRKIVQFRTPKGSDDYLPRVSISQMLEDKHGNIWVRSGRTVGVFDPATFRYKKAAIEENALKNPRADFKLWQDSENNIYLLVSKVGVLSFDSSAFRFASDIKSPIKAPGKWSIQTIVEDPYHQRLWLGCDSGLAMFDKRKKELYSHLHNPEGLAVFNEKNRTSDAINIIFIDQQKRMWLSLWDHAKRKEYYRCFDMKRNIQTRDTLGLEPGKTIYKELHGFAQQTNNTLWAFGRMQLYSFDEQLKKFNYIRNDQAEENEIRFDYVYTMFEDREHNLWIGTDQGVYSTNTTQQFFKSIRAPGSFKPGDLSVTGFHESSSGELYVTTWGQGLITFDQNLQPLKNKLPFSTGDNNYQLQWSIYEQNETGKLWIGCQAGRLVVYDLRNHQSKLLNPKIFENKTIRQIMGDSRGNIWFATQYGVLAKWNSRTGHIANFEKELEIVKNLGTIIYKIYEDQDGMLWVGTHEFGLFRIDPDSGKIISQYNSENGKDSSIYSNIVTDIVTYNDSTIIIANGAINFLNIHTGKTTLLSANEGLPSNTVNNIEQDGQGNLWISMLSGLCRYNLSKHLFASYSQRDGIFYDNFEAGAKYKMRNGMMLFGTTHDFIAFQPEKINSSQPPPNVTITDFKLFNLYLPPDSIFKLPVVKLGYKENSITLEFAALSFLQKDKVVYYFYKLEGIDKDWIRTDRLPLANYTQLPPGDYTFKVWCENSDGLRSKEITSLKISIAPPFWKTWWFMILVAITIAAIVYLVHRIRINRILGMEKVRRRIARDLHDDMGSTLSTINILSEMAKMKVSTDSDKTREFIEKISENSNRMMEAMDDIVWSINPMNDNMQKVAARMREFATGVFEAKNINYSFTVDEAIHDLKLDMEARRDFFLLFKESVNNLAKYSQCVRAEIEILLQKNMLTMRISDDGIGFDTTLVQSGNGLINIRKRAQSLGGTLSIRTAPGLGTIIKLDAPV